jgi:hypothetical protein
MLAVWLAPLAWMPRSVFDARIPAASRSDVERPPLLADA